LADVFISYAHSTGQQARAAAEALKAAGYSVWLDDDLPAHRPFRTQIQAELSEAKAALVIWSVAAASSDWVLSEADGAREAHKLVQLKLDGVRLPMPFDQIQCTDLTGWTGDSDHPGWRKVLASIAELVGGVAPPLPHPSMPAAPLPLQDKPSIAVLPFANLSNDTDQDYFAEGMAVEIVAAISRYKNLFVIGSGSTFAFKSGAVSPQEAAKSLGVRYVLEGSVRKAASRVRITVSLTDAIAGVQIWTNRFEDTLDDVFALQDRVALAVAGAMDPTVYAADMARAVRRPAEDSGSYDFYLRGLAALRDQTQDGWTQALTCFERAVALNPDYGLAWAMLSTTHTVLAQFAWSDPDDAALHVELARQARHEALRSAPDEPFVLSSAAMQVLGADMDPEGAVALVERAIALNPGQAVVWMFSGNVRLAAGEIDLAAEYYEKATQLDPVGVVGENASANLAAARFLQGRYEEAIMLCKRCLQSIDSLSAYMTLAACYGRLGDRKAAQAALASYQERSSQPIEAYARANNPNPAHQQAWLVALAAAKGS
jgi:adenylate cyclase